MSRLAELDHNGLTASICCLTTVAIRQLSKSCWTCASHSFQAVGSLAWLAHLAAVSAAAFPSANHCSNSLSKSRLSSWAGTFNRATRSAPNSSAIRRIYGPQHASENMHLHCHSKPNPSAKTGSNRQGSNNCLEFCPKGRLKDATQWLRNQRSEIPFAVVELERRCMNLQEGGPRRKKWHVKIVST